MFKQKALPLDTQLSPDQLANLMIVEAIEQLQKVTQLSTTHCEQLIADQFSLPNKGASIQTSRPVINTDESEYISQLF